MVITPFPEPESPELERFALYDREAIVALLSELRDRQVMVTLYYDHAAGFTVSNVLDVDRERDEVILDCAADSSAQSAVDRAREVVLVAFLDTSKIQFNVTDVEPVMHQSRTAFRVRLPRRLLRMQRRSAPRRQPLATRPAMCLVPVPDEEGRYECVRVLDISLGGLAMAVPPVLFQLARDQTVQACYLDLPDVGQITVALKVRYMDAWPGEGGSRRCGCEFMELGGSALRSLQRYINLLEAARQPADGKRAA